MDVDSLCYIFFLFNVQDAFIWPFLIMIIWVIQYKHEQDLAV